MIRKHSGYLLTFAAWAVVTMGGFFAVVVGITEPTFSIGDVPAVAGAPRELTAFGAMVVVFLSGTAVIRGVQKLSWLRVGRRAGLSREGGLFPTPHLTGTVDGRSVRARPVTREEQSTSEQNTSTKNSYTVVEVALEEPESEGIVIRRADDPGLVGSALGGGPDAEGRDRISVYDDSDELPTDEVLSGATQDALLAPAHFDTMSVGTGPQWLLDEGGSVTRTFLGALGSGTLAEQVSGDPHDEASWVTLESRGTVLNADELDRQVAAAVAVAEAHESVEANAPRA